MGLSIFWNKNILESLGWEPEKGTTFAVISRKRKRVVAYYKAPGAFSFHTINAFETTAGDVILDLVGYDDATLVRSTYVASLLKGRAKFGDIWRYTLPNPSIYDVLGSTAVAVKDLVVPQIMHANAGIELPRIHPNLVMKEESNWVYALATSKEDKEGRIVTFGGIKKLSLKAPYTVQTWSEPNLYPSEPIFITSPTGKDEDDGVLLTVAFDSDQTSSALIVLDAKTMKEVARCVFKGSGGHVVGYGFHGAFWSEELAKEEGGDLEY